MSDITDEMIDKAARAHAEHEGYDWAEVSGFWQQRYLAMARIILESALAGRLAACEFADRLAAGQSSGVAGGGVR